MKIRLEQVTKTYENQSILTPLTKTMGAEHAIAIIGPSGAGKSTLLRLLSKIEEPDTGDIYVNDTHVNAVTASDYYKKVGFVFQSHSLFPHLTVLRNITLILEKVHKKSKAESEAIACKLLDQFNLLDQKDKLPSKLSGGQSQRVSIVRSLAVKPEVVFLDEPTSALDPVLTEEVLNTILKLRESDTQFVIVTHEILFAKKVADYIIFMEAGNIVEAGPVSILDNPQTEELKGFLSKVFLW